MKKDLFYAVIFLFVNTIFFSELYCVPQPELTNIFYNLPRLESERIMLRKVQVGDENDLHQTYGDHDVAAFVPWSADHDLEQTAYWVRWRVERYAQGLPTPWAIVHKESRRVIGLCGFYAWDTQNGSADLLITLAKKYWQQGFAVEAGMLAIACGFEAIGLNRIQAWVDPAHKRMNSILERAGFLRVGVVPQCLYCKGAYWDRVLYVFLREKYDQEYTGETVCKK